jgi:hypothetical protein
VGGKGVVERVRRDPFGDAGLLGSPLDGFLHSVLPSAPLRIGVAVMAPNPVLLCPSCGQVMQRRPIPRPQGRCPP